MICPHAVRLPYATTPLDPASAEYEPIGGGSVAECRRAGDGDCKRDDRREQRDSGERGLPLREAEAQPRKKVAERLADERVEVRRQRAAGIGELAQGENEKRELLGVRVVAREPLERPDVPANVVARKAGRCAGCGSSGGVRPALRSARAGSVSARSADRLVRARRHARRLSTRGPCRRSCEREAPEGALGECHALPSRRARPARSATRRARRHPSRPRGRRARLPRRKTGVQVDERAPRANHRLWSGWEADVNPPAGPERRRRRRSASWRRPNRRAFGAGSSSGSIRWRAVRAGVDVSAAQVRARLRRDSAARRRAPARRPLRRSPHGISRRLRARARPRGRRGPRVCSSTGESLSVTGQSASIAGDAIHVGASPTVSGAG